MTAAHRAGPRDMRVLAACPRGQELRLAGVRAGRELRSRLASMGLVPGVRLRVIRQEGRGPMVVAIRDMRLAIGRGMAERMDVEAWTAP